MSSQFNDEEVMEAREMWFYRQLDLDILPNLALSDLPDGEAHAFECDAMDRDRCRCLPRRPHVSGHEAIERHHSLYAELSETIFQELMTPGSDRAKLAHHRFDLSACGAWRMRASPPDTGIDDVPRYFFDCDTGEHQFRDDAGIDLPDLNAVAAETFGLLRDLVQGEMPEGLRTYTATVRDEHSCVVYGGEMTVRGQRF